jgi:hypothetical protein
MQLSGLDISVALHSVRTQMSVLENFLHKGFQNETISMRLREQVNEVLILRAFVRTDGRRWVCVVLAKLIVSHRIVAAFN